MTFSYLNALFGIGVIFAVVLWIVGVWYRRPLPLPLDVVFPTVERSRRFGFLTTVTVLLLLASLALPQWGTAESEVQVDQTYWLVVDVSRSMLVVDVNVGNETTTRLEIARRLSRRFLKDWRGRPVGVLAFAGSAQVLSPPTTDEGFLVSTIDNLTIESAPPGGSNLSVAVELLQEVSSGPTVGVLLSDGGNSMDWAAPATLRDDLTISAIGIGNPVVDAFVPQGPGLPPLLEGRKPVSSRLLEKPLQEIARWGHGSYWRADRISAAPALVSEAIEQGSRRASPASRFRWFLLPAFAVSLLLTYKQGALWCC